MVSIMMVIIEGAIPLCMPVVLRAGGPSSTRSGRRAARGPVLGLAAHGVLEDDAVLDALLGPAAAAVPPLDHTLDACKQPHVSLALRDLSLGGMSGISATPKSAYTAEIRSRRGPGSIEKRSMKYAQ